MASSANINSFTHCLRENEDGKETYHRFTTDRIKKVEIPKLWGTFESEVHSMVIDISDGRYSTCACYVLSVSDKRYFNDQNTLEIVSRIS